MLLKEIDARPKRRRRSKKEHEHLLLSVSASVGGVRHSLHMVLLENGGPQDLFGSDGAGSQVEDR